MSYASVFGLAGELAMVMWLLLLIAPRWKVTTFLMDYRIVPIVLSFLYAFYLVPLIARDGMPDFGNFASVLELFTVEPLALAGWIHYLAFDLLIGIWIIEQNRSLGIHHLLIVPCLLATFMLGPIGFLLFMVLKLLKSKL
ncbi:MAG: ABA4-like family protein [Bacteroidota bacterium]